MATEERGNGFKIWAVDNAVYGPVELPVLVGWIKEERVVADTWIYVERDDVWEKAGKVTELRMFFQKSSGSAAANAGDIATPALKGLTPGMLRRVKILAEFSDSQLARLTQIMEVIQAKQWATVVTHGDHGDSMFMVLEGELRVRMMVGKKESTLATLGPGECFGEISLFDHGVRSADVIANQDSTLLKISAPALDKLVKESADVAALFLMGTIRTLTARIRADNKRYHDTINFARTAQ